MPLTPSSYLKCIVRLLWTCSIGIGFPSIVIAQSLDQEHRWITGVSTTLGKTKDFTPHLTNFPRVYQPILLSTGEGINRANSVFVSGYLGRKINSHWMVGAALEYRYARIFYKDFFIFGGQDTLDFTQKYSEYSIGIFGRFLINPEQRLQFFIQPYIVVGTSNGEQFIGVSSASKYTSIPIRMQLKAGALYRLSRHWYLWCLPVGVDYFFGRETSSGKTPKRRYSEFRTDFDLSRVQLGLEYRF